MSIEILIKTLIDEIRANTNAVTQLASRFGDVVVPERPESELVDTTPVPEVKTSRKAQKMVEPIDAPPVETVHVPAAKQATPPPVTDDDIRTAAKALLQKFGAEKTKAVIAEFTTGKAVDIAAKDRPAFIDKVQDLCANDVVG